MDDAGDGEQGGMDAAGAFEFMHNGEVGLGDTLSYPGNESQKLALIAIDEAHHIHEQGDLQQIVDKYAPKGQSLTRLMLLSDASQSGAIEMAPEFGATEAHLEEVVRSTQRIIAGDAMFSKTGHGVVASHQVTWAPCSPPPLLSAHTALQLLRSHFSAPAVIPLNFGCSSSGATSRRSGSV